MISIVPIMLLFLISCTLADAKCKMTTDDDGNAVYSCIQATFDDVKDIPSEAEWIRFTVSKLSHLPEKAFTTFALRGLSFYNCELEYIDPNAFDGLEKLEQLTFYGSNIYVLKGSWFKDMSSLRYLFLDQNDMVYIEPNVFSFIPNLKYLNIEDNNLNCLTKHALIPLKKLKHVRIDKNPWLCNCYKDLVGWLKNWQIDYGMQNTTETRLECMIEYSTQSSWREIDFDKIHANSSALRTDDEYLSISPSGNVLCVGKNISVLSQIPDNVRSIQFLNSQLPKIPRFAFFRFGNSLRILDVRNCSVSYIHPEAFAGLSKLEQLILFNNSIIIVRTEWFRDLRSLKHLTMDSNEIENIQTSVFPLLDKLQTLSLKRNDIGCFPIRAIASMIHLRDLSIVNNTWICSCLVNFWKSMNLKDSDYPELTTRCTDKKTHRNGGQYISGYRNVTFEQDFANEDESIMNDNAKLAAMGTLSRIEPYDSTSAEITAYENNNVQVAQRESYHKQNVEIADYEYYRLRVGHKQNQQGYELVIRAKYDGFERTAVPGIPAGYTNYYIHHNHLARNTKNNAAKILSVEPDKKKSYISVGGTIWDIITISLKADAIKFERSAIRKIVNDIFSRHVTLRVLEILNCGVREIEPRAFSGLVNLQELNLDDNEISVVRPAWFEGTPNLKRLSLLRNTITRIEHDVFQLLMNLEYFGISNNQLNCIGIDGLSHLKGLRSMDIGNNPWSCLCQIKLSQWLNGRKIKYDTGNFDRKSDWDCMKEWLPSSKIMNVKHENRSFADDVDAKFDGDFEVEESAIMQTIKNNQDLQKTGGATGNSEIILQTENSTEFNLEETEVRQTVPTSTTVEPEHPRGQCRFHLFDQFRESRWLCNGGDILALDEIPSSAERIEFTDSNITIIPANAFVRFPNLTVLHFYNSSIRDIDPSAFATLYNLRSLIFVENNISTVRSSWFHDLGNITILGLVRNSITEIEPDVFEQLPQLERFFIRDNNLRCIYTKSLSSLKNLRKVRMQDNPWKWRCREELTQFFEARNISYVKSEEYDEKRVIADLLPDDNSE